MWNRTNTTEILPRMLEYGFTLENQERFLFLTKKDSAWDLGRQPPWDWERWWTGFWNSFNAHVSRPGNLVVVPGSLYILFEIHKDRSYLLIWFWAILCFIIWLRKLLHCNLLRAVQLIVNFSFALQCKFAARSRFSSSHIWLDKWKRCQ